MIVRIKRTDAAVQALIVMAKAPINSHVCRFGFANGKRHQPGRLLFEGAKTTNAGDIMMQFKVSPSLPWNITHPHIDACDFDQILGLE